MSNGYDGYQLDFIVLFDLVGLKIRQINTKQEGGYMPGPFMPL